MSRFFVAAAVAYLIITAAVGGTALRATIWAYNLDDRLVSDLVTAAIINTAAAVAAMGFFGGFDMIFTIWQFLRNQEAERARNQEREEERQLREEERRLREEERRARDEENRRRDEENRLREEERRRREEEERRVREEERQALRVEREEFIALLRAERARTDALTTLITELTETVAQRANGRDANRDTQNSGGE